VERERAGELERLGADVHLGGDVRLANIGLGDVDLVVASPGFRPDHPLLAAAARAGVPVWGEVELAWRLRRGGADERAPAPWLCVTGTNGKTTTVRMLEAILRAAGLRAVAAGNVGLPLLDAVLAEDPYDVLAVELSSFQLHYARTLAPLAAAVLNVAPDHVDWHGSLADYVRSKGRVYERCEAACIYSTADPETEALARAAPAGAGARTVGVTLGAPGAGMLGVEGDRLVDRAFLPPGQIAAAEIAVLADVRPPAPHNVENALAAAALARAYGVPAAAVGPGLRRFVPDPHRIAHVATRDGVDWVDDSKATNPHAAQASLQAYEHVVWVAGGLAKGARFDDLVTASAARLRAAVLIGRDRGAIAAVVEVDATDTGAMDAVVEQAARLAGPGDTVLLAPACASMDMFTHYAERGDAFAAAVRRRVA
jgi:UDP-N-acetylmuramoylalanine--D-glutamate ligase